MATQPTQNAVQSESPRDLKFNAGKIDEFVTSSGWTYTDRFGNKHYTIEGINYLAQQVMNSFGYVTLTGVSFTTGATVTKPNEVLFNDANNEYYKWTGSFASGSKVVPANSTPESTGGIGAGKWLSVGDSTLRSELAADDGSGMVGYEDETVNSALSRHDENFNIIIQKDNNTVVPDEAYSGFKRWNPIWEDSAQLSNYVFKTPTHVDFQFASDPINVTTGPLFKMGRNDLDQRAANFSQDSYSIKNLMLDGGTGEVAEYEPWTSHMATFSDNRIINPTEKGKWAVNFKAQNWWGHVLDNTYMEYNDSAGNFVKAIDDGGNPSDRYTGNSRLLIKNNRCAWQGVGTGIGVMSYTSAVAVRIKDNSAQNAKTCVILGYPSLFATVDGLYSEMNFGNQQVVQIGDSDKSSPSNIISDILIKDVYANLHGINTNRFIVPGNDEVVMNEIEIDRIFIGGIPSSGFIQPIVTINDLPYQKVIAGRINAANIPLLNLTDNYVSVIDKYGVNVPALNGDLVVIDSSSVSIPANNSTLVAAGWYALCTSATTFIRSGNGTPSTSLRNSRYIASINSPAGATTTLFFQHPRADLLNNRVVTVQCLVNADSQQTFTMAVSVINSDRTKTVLGSKIFDGGGAWKEITMSVGVSGISTSNSFIMCEIACTTTIQKNIFITGHRLNVGAFGLCGDANTFSYNETLRMKDDYPYVKP